MANSSNVGFAYSATVTPSHVYVTGPYFLAMKGFFVYILFLRVVYENRGCKSEAPNKCVVVMNVFFFNESQVFDWFKITVKVIFFGWPYVLTY